MNDNKIISLPLCTEILGIDSENYFLSKLKTDYSDIFPDTHLARYNKRRKNLANKITLLTEPLSDDLTNGEDCFIVDPMPVSVCKMSRELQPKFVEKIM